MEVNWISVDDKLPTIPEGKYGVSVLVVMFDYIFEELHPGGGQEVQPSQFFRGEFKQLAYGENGHMWVVPSDKVTHWMYLPDPPIKEK